MRDRVALGALRENFIRRLEENDDHCPYCKKFLANVKKKNETFLRHAEQHCTSEWRKRRREHMEAEERRADFQPAIEFDIELEDEEANALSDAENCESEEFSGMSEDGEEEEQQQMEQGLNENQNTDAWEADFLNASKEIHISGRRRQTAASFRNSLKEKIGSITVAHVAHEMVDMQLTEEQTNRVLRLCRCLLPERRSKHLPQSIHNIKRALKMRQIDAIEIHMCGGCWNHAWHPCLKADWPLHPNACTCSACTCPSCGTRKRFKKKNSKQVEPQAVCYYFGLEHQINQMFQFRSFRESLKIPKPFDKEGSWWSSKHVRWINGRTGGLATEENSIPMIAENLGDAFKENNSVYSIHFDWIQIKKQSKKGKDKAHSVGAIMLRNDSVEEDRINTERWAMPLMIIPGPREPHSMNMHWKIIGDEFARLEENGMRVRYHEDGEEKEFLHRPFLSRFFCDAKAREKLLKCRGAAATRPCPYCCIEGSGSSKVFGYCKHLEMDQYDLELLLSFEDPGLVRPMKEKKKVQIGVTDPREYKYDLEQLRYRTEIVERANNSGLSKLRKKQVHQVTGLNGKSYIMWRPDLKALHPMHSVQLPLYHLLMLGLVGDFLDYMFGGKAAGNRHPEMQVDQGGVIQLRSAPDGIIGNCDLQDKCLDTKNWSGFLISSLSCFVETYSCFLFNQDVTGFNTLSDMAGEAWGHLRSAVLYFLRDDQDMYRDWESSRQEAQQHLENYARLCEQYMPELCVQNLHVAVCRLCDQERYCGRPNISHDLFMERTIRWIKKFKGLRNNHEKSLAVKELQKSSLTWLTLHMGEDLVVGEADDTQSNRMEHYDTFESDTSYLLGFGRQDETGMGDALLSRDIDIDIEELHDWKVFFHSSALLLQFRRQEILHSMGNDQEIEKFSKIVLFHHQGMMRLAKLKKFFRITKDGHTVSRGAVCDVFLESEVIENRFYGTVYTYKKHYQGMDRPEIWENSEMDFEHIDWCLDLKDIVTKVCHYSREAQDEDEIVDEDKMIRACTMYCATSRSRSGKRAGSR